ARTGAGQYVGQARERLSVQREGSVGMPDNHRQVQENQVLRGSTATPPEPGDLLADLIGPHPVVVPDGPEMPSCSHVQSSGRTAVAARSSLFRFLEQVHPCAGRRGGLVIYS